MTESNSWNPGGPALASQSEVSEASEPEACTTVDGNRKRSDTRRSVDALRPVPAAGRVALDVFDEVLYACSVALRRMGDGDISSIGVTSALPGEGRTTVAAGLAAVVSAELRIPTILVDLDLERRGVEEMVSLSNAPGVAQILGGDASVQECLRPAGEYLQVLPGGGYRELIDVAGQIGSLGEMMADLRNRCGALIADLPPLAAGASTARLADLFESVTVVVRQGGIAVPELERMTSVLTQRPFVILNEVPRRRRLGTRRGGRR